MSETDMIAAHHRFAGLAEATRRDADASDGLARVVLLLIAGLAAFFAALALRKADEAAAAIASTTLPELHSSAGKRRTRSARVTPRRALRAAPGRHAAGLRQRPEMAHRLVQRATPSRSASIVRIAPEHPSKVPRALRPALSPAA